MKNYNYPDLNRHIDEHRSLTRKVMELNKDKRYVFPDNISEFLYSWLNDHIMVIDVELGRFLKEQGDALTRSIINMSGKKKGYIQIPENQIIYYELIDGEQSNPYLVFLHQGLGCVKMYQDFPKLLCAKTKCPGLMYDRTGYGKSSPLRCKRSIHYLHEYAINELPEVIDAVIPDKPFILIGHSDGGSISLIYGAHKPEYLKAIVSEAAHVFVEQETIDGIISTEAAFNKGKLSGLFKLHGDKTDMIFNAWSSTWLSKWFRHWNIEYLLPSIDVPVLVIQGLDDKYGTVAQVNSIVSKCSSKAEKLLVNGCGHAPHREFPEIMMNEISQFINKIADSNSGD